MSTGRARLRLARAGIDVAQVLFTVGVLSRVLAPRGALTHCPASWRCRVLRWHDWTRRSTEDGGRFDVCCRCGVDRGPVGSGPLTTPPWPGRR